MRLSMLAAAVALVVNAGGLGGTLDPFVPSNLPVASGKR